MANLVYLICSLPSLSFEQSPPITIDEFNNDAKKQLSKKQFILLEQASIQLMNSNNNGNIKAVASLLDDLQEDLINIKRSKAQHHHPNLNCLPKSIIDANPLEREIQIMKWQWDELDSIAPGNSFAFIEIIAYKLKLQILLRLQSFNTVRGAQILKSVVNPIESEEGNNGSIEN